jgi:hypothetical protein
MKNYTWKYRLLEPGDLPKKAQRFIEMMDIDTSHLTIIALIPCANGKFYKGFNDIKEEKQIGKTAAIAEYDAIYIFSDSVKVKTAIHELTHIYLSQSCFNKGIKYDLQGMSEKFISQYGKNALTTYALFCLVANKWEEVICEIVATYGRRGQFNKIAELFADESFQIKAEGV